MCKPQNFERSNANGCPELRTMPSFPFPQKIKERTYQKKNQNYRRTAIREDRRSREFAAKTITTRSRKNALPLRRKGVQMGAPRGRGE